MSGQVSPSPRPVRPDWQRRFPNQLTIARLLIAGVFFLVLNQYRYPEGDPRMLWGALVIFVIGMLTDIADGALARAWQVESTFGRIMDPFVDKVMVLGALIYLSGPRFVIPQAVESNSFFNMVSGIYPWMVALMLARELLVTGIRGELESRGLKCGAKISGKLKTLLQSVGIPVIIGAVALDPQAPGHEWMRWLRDGLAYGMTVVTVISGVPYVTGAMKALRPGSDSA